MEMKIKNQDSQIKNPKEQSLVQDLQAAQDQNQFLKKKRKRKNKMIDKKKNNEIEKENRIEIRISKEIQIKNS
jgi:hypothetical protein